jgi:hypothetical protein
MALVDKEIMLKPERNRQSTEHEKNYEEEVPFVHIAGIWDFPTPMSQIKAPRRQPSTPLQPAFPMSDKK